MKGWILLLSGLLGLLGLQSVSAQKPGIADIEAYRSLLSGRRVGIVANQTSVLAAAATPGRKPGHTVDYLREQGISLVRIFSPEHGFRGNADAGQRVGDGVDAKTGLPVVSLYGKKKKPTPEDLEGIDVMVFDMQDVGVRFYTYLSTLHYVMEACAEQDIPLVVMDRPNPNAFYVDGPVLEQEFTSFVGMHPVPVVSGMTIGEYARMINGEGWLAGGVSCRLEVVPCSGWNRRMTLPLPCSPSPNLPDSVSVMLYPSLCFFEGTVISEGRGTRTPFQVFGHPDLEDMPYAFVPRSIPGMCSRPKCEGLTCRGRDLRGKYDEVKEGGRLCLDWLLEAYRHYGGKKGFFTGFFDKLAGNASLREAIVAGHTADEIRASWKEGLERFGKIREKYLIYRD